MSGARWGPPDFFCGASGDDLGLISLEGKFDSFLRYQHLSIRESDHCSRAVGFLSGGSSEQPSDAVNGPKEDLAMGLPLLFTTSEVEWKAL